MDDNNTDTSSSTTYYSEGQARFVLIVFIMFGVASFLHVAVSFLKWNKRKLEREAQERHAILLLEQHRLARIAREEEVEDSKVRSRILMELFPPQTEPECNYLMYDVESKSYQWFKDHSVLLNGSCSICLDTFEPEDPIVSGKCFHPYHYDCIMGWMEIKNECPYCRHPMWSKEVYEEIKADVRGETTIESHHASETSQSSQSSQSSLVEGRN